MSSLIGGHSHSWDSKRYVRYRPTHAAPSLSTRYSAHTQAALIPLTIQNVLDPNKMFKGLLPPGFDLATDGLNKSLRVEMAGLSSAHGE